jgi:aminoglycoside phosphotransferase (APT) family kinase protein
VGNPDPVRAMAGRGAGAGAGAGTFRLVGVSHAQGGQANETLLVDLDPSHPGMVVRLAPLEPSFPEYDLGPQALVQNAVAAAGVPAPAPALLVTDPEWIGSPFLVMPRVLGDIPGPAPFFDPYVRDAGPVFQRVMHDELIDAVADIHAIAWEARGLGSALPGGPLPQTVERWVSYVGRRPTGQSRLRLRAPRHRSARLGPGVARPP